MGFIDQTGKVVVPPVLKYWGGNGGAEFHDGLLEIGVSHGVYVDRSANTVIDKGFFRGWDFSEGLAVAMPKDSKKWGYINTSGEWVIDPRFDTYPNGYVSPFRGGFAEIEVAGKIGYIDRTGAFAIAPRFLKGESFFDGFARVVVEGPCSYSNPESVCPDSGAVPNGTKQDARLPSCKYTFVNRSGKIISDDRYDYAGHFAEGLAPVRVGERWGYIDKTGKIVIAPKFDKAAPFSDGVALVSANELYGYIDHTGKYVIAPRFTYAEDFSGGLAVVGSLDSGVWYIDSKGKQAIAGKFAIASGFFKGLAHVRLKSASTDDVETFSSGKFAYIDRTGRRVFTYTIGDK